MKKTTYIASTLLFAFGLAACSFSSSDETSSPQENESGAMSTFQKAFSLGKKTSANQSETTETWCPSVDIRKGGANIRLGSASNVNTQLTIRHVARECILQNDNTTRVKVGVIGFALLGPGGKARSLRAPVHIVIRDKGRILTQRVSSPTVQISPSTGRGEFVIVEDNFIIPAQSVNTFEIELGLSSGKTRY